MVSYLGKYTKDVLFQLINEFTMSVSMDDKKAAIITLGEIKEKKVNLKDLVLKNLILKLFMFPYFLWCLSIKLKRKASKVKMDFSTHTIITGGCCRSNS